MTGTAIAAEEAAEDGTAAMLGLEAETAAVAACAAGTEADVAGVKRAEVPRAAVHTTVDIEEHAFLPRTVDVHWPPEAVASAGVGQAAVADRLSRARASAPEASRQGLRTEVVGIRARMGACLLAWLEA